MTTNPTTYEVPAEAFRRDRQTVGEASAPEIILSQERQEVYNSHDCRVTLAVDRGRILLEVQDQRHGELDGKPWFSSASYQSFAIPENAAMLHDVERSDYEPAWYDQCPVPEDAIRIVPAAIEPNPSPVTDHLTIEGRLARIEAAVHELETRGHAATPWIAGYIAGYECGFAHGQRGDEGQR